MNRCPTVDESFPCMLLGWRAETTPGGFLMISPRMAAVRTFPMSDQIGGECMNIHGG